MTAPADIRTGVKNEESVATALSSALGDTYRLMVKTHIYHWNLEGPQFFSIHKLTEGQYEDLFKATDVMAERIRALGVKAPDTVEDLISGNVIGATQRTSDIPTLVKDLADDHERLALRMHAVIRVAEAQNDAVTADLITARSSFHEQAAWMLRASQG
ncbi:Dps family protein [Pseudoroseicyclus tamaricis]|uniref:DNA starvation/stationary phase protection protein n=1 Tax=Pseudoroseicyclus tamaricis TaxID=2705421 RepID=A0A6B2JJ57_9RHOB|nr:DNA starvation/stationary phase protection protein [Pseudoroseicyclus tamaricis]NDV01451.1 DNA starvation/stationary phase protection protein [Pseudoroseicyclus tamaricis]